MRLRTSDVVVGARPTRVAIRVGDTTVERDVPASGVVAIRPTRARSLTVTVLRATSVRSVRAGLVSSMPVVVGELDVEGVPAGARLADSSATGVPCGFGPQIEIDGHRVPTRVDGTVGDVRAGRQLRWRACEGVGLANGTHTLVATSSAEFVVDGLSLEPEDSVVPAAVTTVRPTRWGSAERTVPLAAATARRVLVVAENQNAGWSASLHGHRLDPVTVDGWAQGWVVPAGSRGDVHLVFGPQRLFRAALVAGAGLALLVVLAAIVPGRRRRRATAAATPMTSAPGRPLASWVGWAVVTGACVLALGPGGLLVLVWGALAALLSRRSRSAEVVLLWLLTAMAGVTVVAAAWSPWPDAAATNRHGVAQVLAVVLVTAAAAWCVRGRRDESAGRRERPSAPAAR